MITFSCRLIHVSNDREHIRHHTPGFVGRVLPAHSALLAIETESYHDGKPAIGGHFRVFFPQDWPEIEKYSFNWAALKAEPDRFQTHDFNDVDRLSCVATSRRRIALTT